MLACFCAPAQKQAYRPLRSLTILPSINTHREAGDPAKAKSYLPPDKQYLVTRNVPSRRRAAAVEGYGAGPDAEERVVEADSAEGDDGGWVAPPAEGALGRLGGGGPGGGSAGGEDDDGGVPPLLDDDDDDEEGGGGGPAGMAAAPAPPPPSPPATVDAAKDGDGDDGDDAGSIPDLDDLEIVDAADAADDPAALPVPARPASGMTASSGWGRVVGGVVVGGPSATAADPAASAADRHVLRTRTYDLMLTYDKYYQTPRVWLVGYDEGRSPLPSAALLDDVAAEHARKTVTWDPFPHGHVGGAGGRAASIHPCRHATVMKKLASVAAGGGSAGEGGGATALPVERYMVLFLKFIAAVIPTVEYDFTLAATVAGGPGNSSK